MQFDSSIVIINSPAENAKILRILLGSLLFPAAHRHENAKKELF